MLSHLKQQKKPSKYEEPMSNHKSEFENTAITSMQVQLQNINHLNEGATSVQSSLVYR
jgi:hypothetical protein